MRRLAIAVLASLAAGTPAAAQAPVSPTDAKLSITLDRLHRSGGARFAIAGDRLVVRGRLSPWVPGQKAIVRVHTAGRKVRVKTVSIRAAGGGGEFRLGFAARTPGRYSVRAVHRRTAQLGTLAARPRRVTVASPSLRRGARGVVVRAVQRSLAAMRYVTPLHGVLDDGTARAVLAWRKVTGRPRVPTAGRREVRAILRRTGRFRVRHPGAGRHAEADLSRQVLALIDDGHVERVYHTSSGAPSTPTVRGSFRVYLKTPGVNASGMVHSVYFHGGYAIHGYPSVPPFPASHGCLRVPIPNARSIFEWLRPGNRVIVYA